jgi:Group XII secretory phospholipase A2 precursor (PLA2G12)
MMRLSLLLLLVSSVTAQFENFGEPKFCTPYQCPKDHEPVPKWPLKLTSPGCSGMGGMQVFSPGASDEDDPTKICCDLRNACLQTCGALKSFCDEEYLKCGKEACKDITDDDQRTKCESSANINELMIKMDNCQRYDQEQYTHCECVKKADAAHKRERVLRAFYKKFNPDAVDKVPALAKKADTAGKMVGLLLKLYKKYPEVIQKIKDPQQEYMEKIMRDAKKDEAVENDGDAESDAEDLGVDEL